MLPARRPAGAFASLIILLAVTLAACGGESGQSGAAQAAIESPTPTLPRATSLPATPTPLPPTPVPTPTPPPPGLQFKPPQIVQGGVAIVYLNENATSATATFGGRQYPMLHDNGRWWTIIGVGAFATPGLAPVSVLYTPAGKTSSVSTVASIVITKRDFPVENIQLDSQTASLLAPEIVNAEIARRAAIFSGFTAQKMWNGVFQAPGRGPISSIYGEGRSYNGAPVTDYHRGTDFAGEIGAPVVAAAAGRIVFTGALRVRGNAIIIDHGSGVFTAYHHLSAISARDGQTVAMGERIGDIGSTGLATGPHLHWDVVIRGVEVSGALFLDGKEIGP